MTRKFSEGTLVVATHNEGKLAEIKALLGDKVKEVVSAGSLGLPEPEEDGETFADNAIIKAKAAAEASGKCALADDSGLAVTALDGLPGVHSARWGGKKRDFDKAMWEVQMRMQGKNDKSAAFVCVLALAWPDGHVETVEGRCEGKITWPPRGVNGFGYDPIFVPEDYFDTFAEMDLEQKQKLSHRGAALRKLLETHF